MCRTCLPARLFRPAAIAIALAVAAPAPAQAPRESLAGVYDGHQVEVAATLVLGDDGRFEYYLSYGALDEMATGTWTPGNGAVVLDSDPVNAPAFALLGSDAGSRRWFDIVLEVPAGLPVELFSAAVLLSDGTAHQADFREDRLRFRLERGQAVSALWLAFPAYRVASDRIEVPQAAGSMRFRFEPHDLGKVDFDGEALREEDGALVLERYDRVLRFRRQDDTARGDD